MKNRSEWLTTQPRSDNNFIDDVDYDPGLEGQDRRIDRAYESGGIVAAEQEYDRLVGENATGDHSSKPHKIRVPTKAGEPLRA